MATTSTVRRARRWTRPSPSAGQGRVPPARVLAAFILPAFVLYGLFMVVPLVQALYFSLFEWRGTARGDFAGTANFVELFTRYPLNEQLPRAFLHNTYFFAGTMVLQNTFGLFLAVLLQRTRWGKTLFRTIYTLPYLFAPLVVGYLWSLILNPTFGPVNALLRGIGLESLAVPWLGDPSTALPVVIVVNAWQWIGFPLLLFGAALGAIPDELHEAAYVDGAGAWNTFFRITLPLLVPVVGTVTVLTFIGNYNVFGLIWAMGGVEGGPAGSTDVLGLLFYRTAFRGGVDAFGVASALAVLMFAFIFGLSLVFQRVFRRLEERLS
ncbi:carbohydrate ABC transporter permease [Nitriliruptor alkaliphilus]|uniref:carbohydrate ABC transporter permease n=1 Tax=Nitriliruptor alkaliphilus TaxID=427918 RepID=UPI001B8004D7|nr:sugar ABC transporter permease [Nitriliruptor alkaliphilus]